MRCPRALVLVPALLVAAPALVSSSAPVGAAGGTVQVGGLAGGATTQSCATLTAVQRTTDGSASSYVVPRDGILTSWRWEGAPSAAGRKAAAVVFRPDGTGSWTVVAKSRLEPLQDSTTAVFTTRLRARAGDVLGLTVSAVAVSGTGCWYSAPAGNTFGYELDAQPAVGATFAPAQPTVANARLSIAADLEPDIDRDGYGDVTQDRCPTQASAGAACDRAAPQTTITAKPRSGTDRSVVVKFRSSESRSTYRCSLDGAAYTACTSPKGAYVRPGTHVFKVRATDRWGNTDRTPAGVRWTVRR